MDSRRIRRININNPMQLREAARRGDIDHVRLLLAAGADPRAHNSIALTSASRNGHIDIVRILLDGGADPSRALAAAASGGHANIVRELLVADANQQGINRALEYAARHGHADIVRELLAAIDADPASMNTALLEAARHGNVDIVRILLDAGADPEIMNTALLEAARDGYIFTVRDLLDAGAVPNRDIIDQARNTEIKELLEKAQANRLRKIKRARMPPNDKLQIAINIGDIAEVERLLARGADPTLGIITAATNGRADIVRVLLDAGADANYQDGRALEAASMEGYTDIVRMLLKARAQPTQALFYAVLFDRLDIVRMLLDAGAVPDQDLIVKASNPEIKELLENAQKKKFAKIKRARMPPAKVVEDLSTFTFPELQVMCRHYNAETLAELAEAIHK